MLTLNISTDVPDYFREVYSNEVNSKIPRVGNFFQHFLQKYSGMASPNQQYERLEIRHLESNLLLTEEFYKAKSVIILPLTIYTEDYVNVVFTFDDQTFACNTAKKSITPIYVKQKSYDKKTTIDMISNRILDLSDCNFVSVTPYYEEVTAIIIDYFNLDRIISILNDGEIFEEWQNSIKTRESRIELEYYTNRVNYNVNILSKNNK